MTVVLAEKTLAAIEKALRADQGAAYRRELGIAVQQCDDAFDPRESSPFRSHLGASIIGRDCPRELWYNFHWFKKSSHMGKTIRLFNRGHLEEARFVALLRMIGCEVFQIDSKGKQFRISYFGGHYGSAIDGVSKGVPDVPNEPVMCEFKTYNDKNFQKLKKNGVQSEKPEHYAQMQQYIKYFKLRHCLYLATNKNDDELYGEIIEADPENAERHVDRAEAVIFSDGPPPRAYANSASFTCKYCDYRGNCHKGEGPEVNCRTCQNARPQRDGTWKCVRFDKILSKDDQLKGCNVWELIHGSCTSNTTQLPDFSGAFNIQVLSGGEQG